MVPTLAGFVSPFGVVPEIKTSKLSDWGLLFSSSSKVASGLKAPIQLSLGELKSNFSIFQPPRMLWPAGS